MEQKIQLYSLATPNGQKISIALEEMNLPYDAHTINILKGDQFTDEFIAINPNSKIPAIVDNEHAVFESGAILIYLAQKSEMFLPKDPLNYSKVMQWLFFQVGGVGPMFGQFGHFFKYAKDKCDHPYPVKRYTDETKRLLAVVNEQLKKNEFIAGPEITIADFATMPWIVCLDKFYQASTQLELESFDYVNNWVKNLLSRPGIQKGMNVCQI